MTVALSGEACPPPDLVMHAS